MPQNTPVEPTNGSKRSKKVKIDSTPSYFRESAKELINDIKNRFSGPKLATIKDLILEKELNKYGGSYGWEKKLTPLFDLAIKMVEITEKII